MKKFYDEDILLDSELAKTIYNEIKDLPIIDYHCHLDAKMIANDAKIGDIGQLWLSSDHYKWRAMRLNNVDEDLISGKASFHDKFLAYAKIMPNLINNPLYHWTHLELKNIYDINLPLNSKNAEEIYTLAMQKGKDLTVRKLLKKFSVEIICTTDDPIDSLEYHRVYDGIKLLPTFRTDKLLSMSEDYLQKLSAVSGITINSATDLIKAVEQRIEFFVSKGCLISDQSFEDFPATYCDEKEANDLFLNRNKWSKEEKEKFFGFLLLEIGKMYRKYDITMQIHFAVKRNINYEMFNKLGVDNGFDVMSDKFNLQHLIDYLSKFKENERPKIILYSLNDNDYSSLACLSGAFRNVYLGAAWWFNDTKNSIIKNLTTISEYACLGTHLGMLTDSRSFSSYIRFDYFRRILSSFIGGLVEKGEYNLMDAIEVARNISYFNIAKLMNHKKLVNLGA